QSELTQLRKERFLELSGLPGRIDQAIEQRNESESVQLLAEIHPLAFLTEQERLLRGLDAIESPLGKIMGHLSEMYRRLNTPDMREYVDYYSAKLEAGGLFDTFPTIRERLINYRNSLVDPPPELLKQVHTGLRDIEDRTGEDHRECVAQQVRFLHECLENEVFGKVWPTIAVILENILKEELASLGETDAPIVSWRNRLQREEQTTPRAIANILAEVEPESGSAIAGILSTTDLPSATARPPASGLSSATPGHRGTGFDFLANRSLDPHGDAQKMQESLTRQFATDAHAAHALSIQILNSSEYSLLEKETTLSVLERANLAAATELYHFDRLVSSAGTLDDQLAFAASLRNGSAGHLVADRLQSLEFRRAQNQSMGHFSAFLATKDPSAKTRLFQEIARDPHIPEGMKSVFRKGADANSFEKFLESITTSSQSNANKLKLLRILQKIAVHRNWLTPSTKERLENRIRFYERILSADQEIAASVVGRLDYYRTRREEIRQALMTGKPAREKLTPPNVESPAVESAEEVHRHGFSDELLESLIQSPMRASRWYSKLPESSKEELHKQATSPGKAQILVNQIQKDIAFKKAIRHLKKPVEAAVFSELSAQFPEPEYQEKLRQFTPSQKETKVVVAQSQSASEDSSTNIPSGAIGPDASFDQLVNQTLLSGPDLPPLPEEDLALDHRPGPPHPAFAAAISKNEERTKHDVTSSKPTPPHPQHHAEPSHHEGTRHEPHHERHPEKEHPSHAARAKTESAVDGLAASLARGFSGLFSKKTSAPSHGKEQKAQSSSHGAHDKKSGKKKTDQAAATLMKAVSSYAKGEIYLSEKDLKSLEKEMEKHPNAKRLIEDHAYLFKVEHPDPAQFQPPIFVIIPEMKALNHDPTKKKAVMTRIEQSISSAPSKKKAHMQALLTFMERYKTK
ncbi:MAG TPA: hypothetical protein PKJ30_14960, partial [Leptospiraceae bacterium]|nr:hypothetical protein [Leptospiraceae bacterium]